MTIRRAWLILWALLLVQMASVLSGCGARFEHDPLQVYRIDPRVFEQSVTVFSFGF